MNLKNALRLTVCWLLLVNVSLAQQDSATATQDAPQKQKTEVQKADLGSTKNAHVVGNIYLSGQFTPEDISEIQKAGIERVITLRTDGELKWDEQQVVEQAKLEFQSIPISGPDSISDEKFEQICVLLKGSSGKTLLHCGSATRVGCVWIAHRVLNENIPLAQARQERSKSGSTAPPLKPRRLPSSTKNWQKNQSLNPQLAKPAFGRESTRVSSIRNSIPRIL